MEEIRKFIAQLSSDWQRRQCGQLLEIQEQVNSDIEGSIKWGNPFFSYHGQALLKWYCAKEWINVYFYKGIDIPDPAHMFEETDNKTMRTVKLFADTKLDSKAYAELVKAALQLNK